MAETKKMELSENVTLSFLGNETINEVKLYKYEAKIKNIEKTKTIYLEKEASKYDKTILSDYIVKMVEEHDDQDAFFIVSNNSDDDNKDETGKNENDEIDSSKNNISDSETKENSNAGGGSGGGSESYGGAGGKTYSDDTVELFQDVAKNAGEFDGSNLEAYKFDLIEFIAFKPSVDKLKFISLGELPSAKSSLGQAAVKASEGGCDEAVGMIEDLKAEIESKQIEDAMDAQVQFYQEVDEIQLQQMQRDAQLNFEDDAVTFDPTQYIVSEQEYKDGMRNTLYGTYDSLADFMNAIQSYNYQVLSSTGRMSFAKDSAGLEFFTMTDAEKDALANGEEGTIDFDAGMLAKLGLNSTSELLGIVGGFKSANDLDDFLNSIGDNDAKLAVNEYVNKLIDSRWFSEFSSTEEGKQAYYEYFVNSAKENPNRTARYDEYDAVINTEYINNCIMSGQENLLISELASRPLILRIINDETGIFGNNISYYADIEDEELIATYEKYAKENDGNYPDGIKKVNGSLKQKTYTLIGEQFLYEMDYHADEWKANYNPEKKKYTAFSKQAKYDAEVRSNKGEFVQNYENSGLTGDAERDWAILNGQIEDRARLAKLKENGCLSFEDNNRILEIIGDSENQDLLDKINEVGINGLDEKDRNTLDTLLKNAGFNENQLLNFKLKYASDDNNNITNYIETQNKSLFDKVSEVGYYKLDKEERETIDQMLKEAGFSDYEITNFKTNSNTSLSDKVYQTLGSSALTTGIAFAKGVATFVENCRDAGITISNNNFWLLYGDALKGENDGAIKETKKYKEMQQVLYDEVMNTYKETGAYDRDYEAFRNSKDAIDVVAMYAENHGYVSENILESLDREIEEYQDLIDSVDGDTKNLEKAKQEAIAKKEQLYQEAFLDAKIKELNLGDANASSQMSAAIKLGIRTGDFSKLYEYEKDQQMVDMANNQYSAMLDVAVDNVGNWVQGNIYDKEWYQQVEDASLIKKDNFLGVCVDQIGNMAIPIGLSMIIPGIGGALGATSASSTAALGALAKAVSSTALWTSAFGGAAQESFSQGANYGDAINYSLLSATTELATEWMFSGIMGFGTGWYDDVLKAAYNKTLGNLSSKIIKNPKTRAIIEKLIISGIGEGTEEVVTDLITPLWRSWTLEKELSYNQIRNRDVSFESLFETFSIAFVTSLFFSGMSINGQRRNLNKNIENLSRITESNPAFNEALRNMSSDLFAQIIENDGRLSQREIFNEVIGRFREQIMADPQLREAMDQANAELLKDVIKTDANNNITNMQEVIERLFNDNLLENATAEDISTIENVLTRLTKSNTNITAEQIYQELLNSDSKLIAENFAKASQLNETTKNFIKSFTENSFSYEFKDGSKIDLSQSLLSEISELDQTLHTNSFEINNGELVVKNENKFRKLIEHAAKDRISNLKYQNNLFRKKLGFLNDIDADTIENALYFMGQDSTIAHYTNDNVILEYDGKSINVPVNLAVQIANEIRLDNYIKDGKLVFKSEKEMKAFVNKTCELGAKAIENINKRIDTTPNKTLEDALNINNNRINMEADKNALIINRVVLEDGIVAYDVIMENEPSESDVANENDTGIRRKIIYTTEENLKNVFNEKELAQDVIDLMNQNEDAPNIYLELTNEQVENIEKRIKNEQGKAKEKSNAIEETGTQENANEKMIQERAETREQQTNENEAVDNKDTNVRENIVERNDSSTREATRVKVRPRENASTNVNENANVGENVVERNDSSTSEVTRVKVRPRENASTNVNENTNVGENIVERNDSSTSEATRVKVRTKENASTNVNEAAKASERVDVAQRNNATQTNADVIRNTASAATVVINAVTNNANKASIVVDAPVYGNNTSNREAQGVQNNQKSQTKQNTDNIQNDTANDIKNGFDAMGNGVREAGRRRVMELVQKNGYVAYRNEDAARLFEQNPEYKDWRHEVVDGEHRFYPPESNQSGEVVHAIDEGTIRNTQTVLETNSEIEVIKPENVEQNINQKFKRGFDPSLSYEGFDYVVKPKTSFEQALNEVIANNNGSNIVIEINNTTELTLDLIEQIPDNVKVRVTGDYNVDFMNTFKSAQQSGNGTLRNVTYTKEQLKSIMTEIYEFEKGIDSNWSDMEKARYAYDYLKNSIEYHDVKQIHELSSKEGMAGNNADRLARYDGLVNLIEKSSTCQGFAATYQELLTRMGIESRIVSGNLNGEGQHVYNVVKIDGKTFIVDSVREMLEANSPGKYPGSGFNVENIFEYHAKSSYQELIKESVLTQISENIDEIVKKGVYNGMSLEELSDFIKDNYSETQIPNNLKEFIHQIDEIKMDKAANEVEVEDIHIDEYVDGINEEQESAVEVLTKAKEDLRKLRGGAAGIVSKFLKANAVALTTIANPSLGIGSTITYNMVAEQILNGEFVANNRATEKMKETTLKILTWGYGKEQKTQIRNQIKYIEQVRTELLEQGIDLKVSRSKKIQNIISEKVKVVKENIKNVYGNVKAKFNNNIKTNETIKTRESVLTQISENIDGIIEKGVYNNMNLEELSDFIKDNYSETQIPNNLKEFIHQVDEFKLDKAANEVEVEDIHIDEYADRINEEQVSSVEVLNRAKEDLAKLRGGAAGIISKFLKANAVVLTTIADPSLGIGSTITYNMVAQQILNGEFVANNRATEIMKETTLKILTWGYGKEQKTQIRNQIKYIEQVRMDLIEQGIDLDVSRSKKIQNIISDKTKVVKENIRNVYGNVKAIFNNNVKANEIVVNETSMSNEIVNNRNSRINELINMSRNGTDIHYEYRTSNETSLKEVQKNIVNVYENNSKAIVLDSGSWTHIHIGTNPNTTLDNAIKIYVPIDETNANVVTKQVLDFLLENNIASRNKVGSHVKGDAFVLRIFDKTDAKRVINFINEQVKLNPLTGKEMPLTFKAGGVSVAMDGLTSYNQIATILIDNFAKNNLGTDINGFKEFVHALNEQIINGDVDLFETMFKDQIRNLEENPYINNEQLAKVNVYEVIDIIDKALNNNMNANEFVDYISEYQNTSKVNDVINRITGTEVINENSNDQNRVVKPNIVKTFITNVNEKFRVVRNNIGEKFRIAKENVNQFKADLKAKLEIRRAENSHISADTSNVRIERIKLQMKSLMETYNGKVDFIRESVIKTLEYKNIPVTEENIRTNLEQVLNGNYNVITSREGLRQQVINASNEIKYCTNELSRLSLEISANESGSIIMNAIDLRLDNIIKNANEIGSRLYSEYVEMHFEDMFEDIWRDVEGYFEQNSYDNLVVERWLDGSFLNFTIGQQKHSAFGNAVKMYIPINHANASYMVKTIIEQLAKNNIASDNKISRIARSDAFVLRIYDVNDAYRVANWINNNFNLEATGSELPLCYKFGKIGIAMDGRTSYNSIVTQLIRFYSQNYTQNLDVNGFKDFVRNLKENVILNKNTDILETVFNNYFVDLKERYRMEYKYDENYAKANAYANLYEIVDIVDANLNGNMSPIDFFRYLNEYTKPAKVGNIITNLSSSQINEDATVNQTSSESVVINNNQTTIEEAARLIASNNEYLLAAIRYQEMSGHQLHDLLVETLDLWKSGKINISNEMRFLLDEFAANNGVITNEIIEGVKQALLYTQNKAANNFGLEIGKILENMGYERIMEKFGVSEETLLNALSDLYNNLLKAYKGYGLTEEQLNKIFAKIKFRTLDEMRRIYHKSDVTQIGGVNILGTSYINLGSHMNTRFEIFLENVYHECTHAIGRIVQREINGYQIDGIINEYFTDLQAKKAGGFLESEAYIPRLVNILEEIERIIDPSRELFTQVYVEGNFSSLVDRLTELTGDENLANKLAREIVETIETTHQNMRNATENKQFLMKNYYVQQAEAFVDYLKLQLNNNSNQANTNNSQNINESVNQENNNNVEEIEMIDESTIENREVLEANDVVDVIKVEPNDNNSNNNNDTGNNSSNNMNKMENDNTVEERISSREDLNANQGENANNVFDRATNNLISEYESAKARYKEILNQYDTTMDANERYDLEDEIGIFSNLKLRLAKEIVDTLNISDLFKINNNDLLNDYIDYIGLFYSNESKYNDFIKSIYDIYQSYKANNDLNSFVNKIGEIRKVLIASTAFNISENYIDMCRDLIMNGPKIDIQNMENYTSQEITIYLTFRKSIILECGKFLGQLISENEYTEILDSIDIVSEYAKSKGINIGNELDTDIIRNAMKVKEGNYGVVARNIEIYEGNIVGANQGAVRKALRSGNPKLIKPLIEQVRKNHPNLTTMDAIKFLKIIEYSRSDLGVCNYAIFVNAILEANHIDIAMLEEKLGYKLIENGKLNDARLLADIFTNLNPNFIGEKGMFNHKMAKNNEGYINLSTAYNSNLNSTDDGLNIVAMNKFFREKNIPVVAKSENLIEGLRKNKLLPEQERNYIINRVAEALKNGDCPCLSVYAGTQLYDASNNEIIKLDDAHIVTIFGINENGDLRVDSWGKEYIIKTSDLVNSSVIRLNSLRLEQVDSIDNVDNIERQVKTERIDNIEKNKEIRMPYARAYENVKIFDRLKDKIKFVKENKFKNAKVIVSSKQQFYGETKETLNKSISYYEKLLDDLKIGKKSLFEKVDNAINRDLNTMKNYVSRSEVSNIEAKFLTEKTFLRLAEKYWGNEDAMKILSDIVPSEGDTLRETIASIGDRVCEYELSMYEENASINEIHDVLDIPVKIIGNSSPILYLRLNEFEKAISRMPDNLKNILKTVDIKIYDTECFENASSSIGYFDTPKKIFVIYAGTIGNELRFYEHGASSLTGIPSIEYETITHELGHIIDNRLGNSEKGYTEISDEWQKAMEADKLLTSKNSVSDYGETTIGEDFAESIKFYYRSAGFLKKNFPNRARLVEECINNINLHSSTMNAKTQNFYRSDTALNTKAVKNLLSSKNIELSDIANLDSTKPISKIKDELFASIKSLEIPVDSKVIDRLTYLLDTYKTSNGSIYYKDVIGNDTYIITDNNVLFRVDNNEKSILDIVDYLSNMSNSERNNMFLSFYKDTARIVNSYDTDNINKIHRVLSRLFSSDTYYEHKTKYIDLYRDTNYGAKQDIISYYLKDSSLKERLVKLVKSIYPGMDDINANRLLRHMEVTPTTDEGMCSYSVIANMIYEKYYGNSEAFLNDFGYEMSINSKLNSGELMTDMYAYCNKGVLVNDNIVSKTNEGQVSLSDRKVSSMWNKLFNTNLINSFFKSKNINLEVSEEVLFDYYNINGNTNSLSKNLFDGIISNISKSLEQGKHVAIALSDFDIIVDGFEERINNNHVMSIVSVLDNGLLEVDSWGKKCYIDLKNVTKSASQITISELSLNEK